MQRKYVSVTAAISTPLLPEKAARLADECGVQLVLVETRLVERRCWFHDFEVEGHAGKVDAFLAKVKDLEVRYD
ncbi:MAG TPA: hypothetical protein VN611_12055 [Patescibacteria group bacterium]|nr:hypothetical protein [Patescibacteria group bacterium]